MPTAVENVTGDRLAAARRAAGLSQRGLADRLGVPIWGVEQMEQGRADASPYLSEISSLTGQPLAYFLPPRQRPQAIVDAEEDVVEDIGEEGADERIPRRFLVLGALTVLMTIRFLTETTKVLPKYVNFIDIPLFVIVIMFAVSARAWQQPPPALRAIGALAIMFLGIVLVSVLANLGRIEAAPAAVFVYTVLSPVAWGAAIYRLWPPGNAGLVSRWLFLLGMVQMVVVVFFNVPTFLDTGNPDFISGTFGENGYQLVLVLFVIICALAGVLTYDRQRPVARFAIPAIVAFSVVIFLVQYRTLLLTLALSLLMLGYFMRGRARGALVGVGVMIVLAGALYAVSSTFSQLKYTQVQDIAQEQGPMVFINARLGVASDVVNLYADEPRFVATGTGPGTFSSRAWRTFGVAENYDPKLIAKSVVSRLTGGEVYRTDVSDKYTVPRLRAEEVIGGSLQLTQPYSSYTALAAETGMGGLLAVSTIYILVFLWAGKMTQEAIRIRRRSDPIVPIALASTIAFFILLQLGALENWLEVTRITFFAWALVAITAKELQARQAG